ncbi:lysophospholipid acyltransferase family protein [Occallatibacter riparius]|uniref:Lysophospholipid acyltransferase family protein n=1 Tax=Occallatibacter riparius TaxID=1002689 RepID=A0A9J7BKZ6_9BACT|nr:lysophospholipid acyltransferase family protein [Occallatibacter riparius]UWZ83311.1 lysophospholipid acyltransferase family protein [Occallatibacter riparius]
MPEQESPRFTFTQRIVLAVVPRIMWALLWIVGLTWRFELIAEDGAAPIPPGQKVPPQIYCFWHQCVLPCTFYFRWSRAIILISRSFDGELITRILRLFGFDAVRGSSSRAGREGLMGLKRIIENGRTAIFTADGPRGPIYETKMGPIKLAQLTGVPIDVFHLQPERAWAMNSWDRFLVPRPFTRIIVSWAKGVTVPADIAADQLEPKRQELTAAIERARVLALQHLGQVSS